MCHKIWTLEDCLKVNMLHRIISVLLRKMQKQGDYKPSVLLLDSHNIIPAINDPYFFSVAFKSWSLILYLLSIYVSVYDPMIYEQRGMMVFIA